MCTHRNEKVRIDLNKLFNLVREITLEIEKPCFPCLPTASIQSAVRKLVKDDDWLPDQFARPSATSYSQYLLYCDPRERFSVVSFVWLPGQATPIHDHTVWGVIGQLRGEETSTPFSRETLEPGMPTVMCPGEVCSFSPDEGDIHRVKNSGPDIAVSIHVYGGNIGRIKRSVFLQGDPVARPFISGYSSDVLPNFWGPVSR